ANERKRKAARRLLESAELSALVIGETSALAQHDSYWVVGAAHPECAARTSACLSEPPTKRVFERSKRYAINTAHSANAPCAARTNAARAACWSPLLVLQDHPREFRRL